MRINKEVPFSTTLVILYYTLACSNNGKLESKLNSSLGWILKLLAFLDMCIFTSHHLITSIIDNIAVDISEDISMFAGGSISVLVLSMFKFQQHKWLKVISDVADFSRFGEYPGNREFNRRMNLLSRTSYMCLITAGIIYCIVAYNEIPNCQRMNEKMGLHEFCGSLTPVRLPFEDNSLMVRLPICLFQSIASVIPLTSAAHVTFLMYEITEYLILHIKLLKLYMSEVFDRRNTQESSNKFKFCTAYHNHILKLIIKFNKIAKNTVGELSLAAAIIMGCIGNQVVQDKSMASIVYMAGYVTVLFYICHSGQRIMDETESIAYALYESKWYEANVKLMRNMILVIRRCQKPMTLEALPLGDLNYPLFLMIMKSAYTYLTLLTQTT